jgi:hypothetical protein
MPSDWPAHLIWWTLIHQFGGTPYNEDATQAQFNSDAGVQALTWMVDQAKQGYSPKNVALDAQAVAFRQQKDAMTWDGIWMMNEWAKVKSLDWGAAPIPNIGGTQAVWASSHNFTVTKQASSDTNKAQAAKVFIKWVSDHSIDWAKSGQVPARKSVRESPEFQQLEVQSIAAKELDFVKFPPAGGRHRRHHHAHLPAGRQRGCAGQEGPQGGPGRGHPEGQRPAGRQPQEVRGVGRHDHHRRRRPGGAPGRRPRRRGRPPGAGPDRARGQGRQRPDPVPVPGAPT